MIDAPIVFSVVLALAVMLLVWSGAEIGAAGLANYRQSFTERARFNLRELFLFMDPARLYALNVGVMLLVGAVAWLVTKSAARRRVCARCRVRAVVGVPLDARSPAAENRRPAAGCAADTRRRA